MRHLKKSDLCEPSPFHILHTLCKKVSRPTFTTTVEFRVQTCVKEESCYARYLKVCSKADNSQFSYFINRVRPVKKPNILSCVPVNGFSGFLSYHSFLPFKKRNRITSHRNRHTVRRRSFFEGKPWGIFHVPALRFVIMGKVYTTWRLLNILQHFGGRKLLTYGKQRGLFCEEES